MPDNNKPVGKLTPYTPTESKSKSVTPVGKLTPVDTGVMPHIDDFQPDIVNKDDETINNALDFFQKNSLRTMRDDEKDILRKMFKNPNTSKEELTDAIVTLQGKKAKQQDNTITTPDYYMAKDERSGNYKPIALAYGEKPPHGHDVASLWGTQDTANDDAWYTDLGKSLYNIVPGAVGGVVDVLQLGTELITGSESETLKATKNSTDALKFKKDEELSTPVYNIEGIEKFSDLVDANRFDLSPKALWGTFNSVAESVGEFILGGKGAGAAIKGAKGVSMGLRGIDEAVELGAKGRKLAVFMGSYQTNLGEALDAADSIGLQGRDRASFAGLTNTLTSAVDASFGLEGKILSNAFKKSKAELLQELGKQVEKDALGNITEKGFKDLAKATTISYGELAKTGLKEVVRDAAKEGGQEASQAFLMNSSKQLWDKLTDEDKSKFGTDVFSAKSFGEYIQNGLTGLIGGVPMAMVSGNIKQKHDEQSINAYNKVKEGNDAVMALKTDLTNSLHKEQITQQEYDLANFKIDAYGKYHEETKGVDLKPEDEKRAFELSFQIEGLKTEIPTTPEELKKLAPIPLAKVKSKQDMVNDLQKELNEVLLKGQVKEEPVVAKKTEEKIVKANEKEESDVDKLLKRFSKITPEKTDEGGVDVSGLNEEGKDKSKRLKLVETPAETFNVLNDLQKKQVVQEHLKTTPNKSMEGFIEEGQNNKLHVNLGDGKYIVLAQSVESTEGKKDNIVRENLPKTKELGKIKDAEGQPLISFKEPVVIKREDILAFDEKGKPVMDGDKQRTKAVINVYNSETGGYIVSAREHKFGKSKYTPKEIEQLQALKTNGLNSQSNKETVATTEKVEKTEEKKPTQSNKEVEKVSEKIPKEEDFSKLSDKQIEKELSGLENAKAFTEESKRFSKLEKELEKRERDSIFNVPLKEARVVLENLKKRIGSDNEPFAEKRELSEAISVIDDYENGSKYSNDEVMEDFVSALRGNPTKWYADGLKLRESVNEATKRGITFDKLVAKAMEVYTKDGYDKETAMNVVKSMLEPIFKNATSTEIKQDAKQIESKKEVVVEKTKVNEIKRSDFMNTKMRLDSYNALTPADRKSKEGKYILDLIKKEVSDLGGSLTPRSGGVFSLNGKDGREIKNTPVVRTQEEIQKEREYKAFRKAALKIQPVNVEHWIALAIANKARFNTASLKRYIKTPIKEVPALMKQDKGGINLEFARDLFGEESGLNLDDFGSEQDFITEAAAALDEYLAEGGRLKAIQYAEEIYKESLGDANQGMSDYQLEQAALYQEEQDADEQAQFEKDAKEDYELREQAQKATGETFQKKSSYKDVESEFNEEYINKVINEAKKITDGTEIYKRFSQEEQRGFTEGGRRNVEASIIAGRSVSASENQDERNDRQEEEIQKYAEKVGIWHENTEDFLSEKGEELDSGMESLVHYNEKEGKVYKTSITNQYLDLQDFLDGITIHNTYFPESPRKVIGFGRDSEGDFNVVTEQPFIQGTHDVTQEQIDDYMKSIGFDKGASEGRYKNNDVLINDIAPRNVIVAPSGKLAPFDTIPHLNSKAQPMNEGGTRGNMYGGNGFEKVAEAVSKAFNNKNIKVVVDATKFTGEQSTVAGKVSADGKFIYLNPNYAEIDTPIHEAGHIIIDAMGYNNRIIQAAIKQLRDTDLYKETKLAYPELSNEELDKEVLAEAIGREGAGIFEEEVAKSKFKQYLDYIFDWFKRNLGLEKNIAKSLAKQIIAGIGTKNLKGTNTGKEQLSKKSKMKNWIPEDKYRRDLKHRDLKQEAKDIATITTQLADQNLPTELREQLEVIEKRIKKIQNNDNISYRTYIKDLKKIDEIYESEDLSEYSYEELLELQGKIKSYDINAKDALMSNVKKRIAFVLEKTGIKNRSEVDSFVESVAKTKDISAKDVKMMTLSHAPEYVPGLQEFSKEVDTRTLDMISETNEEHSANEQLARKVIEEKNKSLVGKAKNLFVSDNAKYFEHMVKPKAIEITNAEGDVIGYKDGYWSIDEAKAKGFSKAEINYLKFVRDTIAKRQKLDESEVNDSDMEVVRLDKGFQEAFSDSGIVEATSYYLGGGRTNLANVRIEYKGKPTSFSDIEADIIAKSKKGTLSKVKAIAEVAFYNYHARKQLKRGFNVDEKTNPMDVKGDSQFSINPDGNLVSRFDRQRGLDRGYSKDFFRAMNEYISETNHVKHMNKLLPVAESLEYMAKNGYESEGISIKPHLAEYVSEWKKMHIFKESKPNSPKIDIALKFLRKLTSMTTMMFAGTAQTLNAVMGIYNNFRAENGKTLVVGYGRLFGDRSKAEKNSGVINKYAEDIVRKYNIVSLDLDSNPRPFIGSIFEKYGMLLTKWGEYQTQASLALGLLEEDDYNSFEYKTDANGVEKLVVKQGIDEKKLKDKINSAKNRVSDIQGKYADKDRRNVMRGEFGKAVFQFKVWMPDWWKERFGAEYIDRNNVVRRGTFTTLVTRKGIADLKKQVSLKGWNKGLLDGETSESKAVLANIKGIMIIGSLLALKYSDDEDDEKNLMAELVDKTLQQTLFIYDPEQLKYTIKSPVAIVGTFTKMIDAVTHLITLEENKNGDLKVSQDVLNVLPAKKLIKGVYEASSEE